MNFIDIPIKIPLLEFLIARNKKNFIVDYNHKLKEDPKTVPNSQHYIR